MMYVIIIIAILFRIFFDIAALHGILDISIYYFLFESLYKNKLKSDNKYSKTNQTSEIFSNRFSQ